MKSPTLIRLGLPDFNPLPPFFDGHSQTIAASFWPELPDVRPTATEIVDLPDGDRLVILENRPESWRPGDRVVVLVHGLAGSHQSKYMIRFTRKLAAKGYLVVRVNLRGCGLGSGLARRPYHSGRSDDLRIVQNWIAARHAGSPVSQIGFSLGANITLKLAGEDASHPSGALDSVVAISPPIHLSASAEKLRRPGNRLFANHFLGKLLAHVEDTRRLYPEIPALKTWKGMHLTDLDNLYTYTAPQSGFASAEQYYERAAALPLIPSIRIPTLILTSADDPVVDTESVRALPSIPGVEVLIAPGGGHVAFIGRNFSSTGTRWMDTVVIRWIEKLPRQGAPTSILRKNLRFQQG